MAAPRKYSVSDEQFRQAVAESLSVRQVLERIGLVPAGGNYQTVHARIRELAIDTGHFTGSAWNQGARYRAISKPKPLVELLVEGVSTQTFKLKKRLIKAGLLQAECASCGLSEWLGQPIPLELDHINGVRTDNRIENLRLLCPNCHALTDTYRGKNRSNARVVEWYTRRS